MGSILLLIGRILYALIFIGAGIRGHLMDTENTAGYAASRGVPNARVLVQVSGALIALGGIALLLGIFPDLAALGLAAYCLTAAFMVHHFWSDQDPMTQQDQMSHFMKNLSMAGAGIALFAIFASFGSELGDTFDFFITDAVIDIDP